MDKNDIWHHFAMPENGTHPKLFILMEHKNDEPLDVSCFFQS
jgi:hypothetical protein